VFWIKSQTGDLAFAATLRQFRRTAGRSQVGGVLMSTSDEIKAVEDRIDKRREILARRTTT
jgi:hypothetical protein